MSWIEIFIFVRRGREVAVSKCVCKQRPGQSLGGTACPGSPAASPSPTLLQLLPRGAQSPSCASRGCPVPCQLTHQRPLSHVNTVAAAGTPARLLLACIPFGVGEMVLCFSLGGSARGSAASAGYAEREGAGGPLSEALSWSWGLHNHTALSSCRLTDMWWQAWNDPTVRSPPLLFNEDEQALKDKTQEQTALRRQRCQAHSPSWRWNSCCMRPGTNPR